MTRLMLLLWRVSRRDLGLLWFALRHPSRPRWLVPAAAVLGLLAISPINIALPLLGVVDDLVLVPLALHWLLQQLPWSMRMDFEGDAGIRQRG